MYLARQKVFTVCSSPRIEKISSGGGNIALRSILALKKKTAEKINSLWPEPQASFAAGLLYGYRGGLGRLSADFANAGVTHIVAVSGYNISIVAGIFATLCMYLLIPRKRAFWVSVGGIVVFVIFTGASASVVRAGIMGIFTLCGGFFGRSRSLTNSIVGTAVIMATWSPYALLWDLGLQLSFLATIGLIWLSPVLKPYFIRMPEWFGLRENMTNTTAAILITTPIIMFSTGRISPYALFANLLILWTIPYLMFGAFVSVGTVFVSRFLAGFFGFITYLGLASVSGVVQLISGLPFSSFTLRLPWYGMVLVYTAIAWWYRLNSGDKFGRITTPN
jgi:competence protein ComEC